MRTILRTVLSLALVALLAPPLFPDGREAASWLRSEPRARVYESVQPQIMGLFDAAQGSGVPTGPLMDKLKEGVSKRVDPGVLVAALRAELQRLSVARSLLAGPASRVDLADTDSALRAVSLLLAAGASPQTVGAVLDAGSSASRSSFDTVEALGALAQTKLSIRLPDSLVRALGIAILESRMPQEAFGSIPPLLLRARANGMSSEAAVGMVVSVLRTGGGLIQMEDDLRPYTAERQPARERTGSAAGSAPEHPEGGEPPHPAPEGRND